MVVVTQRVMRFSICLTTRCFSWVICFLSALTPGYEGRANPYDDPPDDPEEPVSFDWQLVKPIMRQLNTPDPSWWNDLPKITAPTLIIGGGPTSHVPQEKLTEVAQLIAECKLVTIDGAGHAVHENHPEEYKALLRDFLFR
jgi:esterase